MDSLQDGGNWQQDEGEEPEIFLPLLHLLLWELSIKMDNRNDLEAITMYYK